MKGQLGNTELEALPAWAHVVGVERLAVPGLEAERHLVTLTLESSPKIENRT